MASARGHLIGDCGNRRFNGNAYRMTQAPLDNQRAGRLHGASAYRACVF